MKKKLNLYLATMIFCLFSNCFLKAYTKEDLEQGRTIAAIIEFVSSLPVVFSDKLPPEITKVASQECLAVSSCSGFIGDLCSRALESNQNLISISSRILTNVRLQDAASLIFLLLLQVALCNAINGLLNAKCGGKECRITRRLFRTIIFASIAGALDLVKRKYLIVDDLKGKSHLNSVIVLVSHLMLNGIEEYIGEKIIQGVGECSDSMAITKERPREKMFPLFEEKQQKDRW